MDQVSGHNAEPPLANVTGRHPAPAGKPTPARTSRLKQWFNRWLFGRVHVSRFFLEQLRGEINALSVRLSYRVHPLRVRRLRNLRRSRDVYFNIACGPFPLAGFTNLDLSAMAPEVMPWDCRWNLPADDDSARGIRMEHFLEHVETRQELPSLLEDCKRVLRPGGVLRIIVPDAERYLRAYCRDDLQGFRELRVPDPFPDDLPTRMDVVNHTFHQWHEHRWGYDYETLAHRLRAAGFARVERMAFRRSLDPILAEDREEHAPYSLYVDAVT
jgi:predicted SAM-dependent methyltransferase